MNPRPFEIWKCKPEGFARAHWFVIVSGAERCAEPRQTMVNGLACFTLRGEPTKLDVRLNGADGFTAPTVCQCDFLYALPKAGLHDRLGTVGFERQNAIRARIRETLRLN